MNQSAKNSPFVKVDFIGEIKYSWWSHSATVMVKVGGRSYTITKSKLEGERQAHEKLSKEEIEKTMTCAKMLGMCSENGTTKSVDLLPSKAVAHKEKRSVKYTLQKGTSNIIEAVKEARKEHLKEKGELYRDELKKLSQDPMAADRAQIYQRKILKTMGKLQTLNKKPEKKEKSDKSEEAKSRPLPKAVAEMYKALREKCLAHQISPIQELKNALKKEDVENELVEFIEQFTGDQKLGNLLARDIAASAKEKSIAIRSFHRAVEAMIATKQDIGLLINFCYREGLSSELLKNEKVKGILIVKALAGELELSRYKEGKTTTLNGALLSLDGARIGEGEVLLSDDLMSYAESSSNESEKEIFKEASELTGNVLSLSRLSDDELRKAIDTEKPKLFKGGFKDHAASITVYKNKMVVCNRGAGRAEGRNMSGYTIYTFDKKVPLEALKCMYAEGKKEFSRNQAALKALHREEVELPQQKGNECWLLSFTPTVEILARLRGRGEGECRLLHEKFLLYRRERVLKSYSALRQKGGCSQAFEKVVAKALKNSSDPLWKKLIEQCPEAKEAVQWQYTETHYL